MKIKYTIKHNSILLQKFLASEIQIQCSSVEERRKLVEYICGIYPIRTANQEKTYSLDTDISYLSIFIHRSFGVNAICVLDNVNKGGYWSEYGHLPKINAKDILNKE